MQCFVKSKCSCKHVLTGFYLVDSCMPTTVIQYDHPSKLWLRSTLFNLPRCWIIIKKGSWFIEPYKSNVIVRRYRFILIVFMNNKFTHRSCDIVGTRYTSPCTSWTIWIFVNNMVSQNDCPKIKRIHLIWVIRNNSRTIEKCGKIKEWIVNGVVSSQWR